MQSLDNSPTSSAELRPSHAVAFFIMCILMGELLSRIGSWEGFEAVKPVVDSGLYEILFVPAAYIFDRKVFSSDSWHFNSKIWTGVGAIAVIQLAILSGDRTPPLPVFYTVMAITVTPISEEIVRAVMMRGLMPRLGLALSILITVVLTALVHPLFWVAVAQQLALTAIFVRGKGSIPSTIAAHGVLNLTAAAYPYFHAHLPNIFR
jgi:membrane protease YdiL (CAAX protease family)